MRSVLFLAWRYLVFHRVQTAILVVCLATTAFLPLAVSGLVRLYERELAARAVSTPLLLGVEGYRFDLTLESLYFRRAGFSPLSCSLLAEIEEMGLARAIPLHARFSVRGVPVVGTSHEYFEFRGLRADRGRLPGILGEAVVGARVARELGLSVDDRIVTDQENLYDLSKAVAVRLRVVGILAETDTADDGAIFVDVRSTWILEGLGHGHEDLASDAAAGAVLERREDTVVANASVETWVEVTSESLASFHFHGETGTFPIGSIILVPRDEKARTILSARLDARAGLQVIDPRGVVTELFAVVFRVKRFLDAQFAIIAVSNALFLVLVLLLTWRLRSGERRTIQRMGGSRGVIVGIHAAELGVVLVMSGALVVLGLALLTMLAPRLVRLL